MYLVPFCRFPVTASLGMMSGYSPAHWAASGISEKTVQLVGDFGKRGDLSSGEPELRGWKRRSVTCLQQFAKRLFPMPGSCSVDQSSQLCFTHTRKSPQGTLPRAARALRCLLAVRCLLQRECLLGPRVAGHKRTSSCLRTGSHVPCAHQNWMLGLQQFPQNAAWRPSSTARLRPCPQLPRHPPGLEQLPQLQLSSPLLPCRSTAGL